MKPYRRKLSREDADTGTILITKGCWGDFPPPKREFSVIVEGEAVPARIVAENCSCVTPPHQHMHLEAGPLPPQLAFKRGRVIEIVREGQSYVLRNG